MALAARLAALAKGKAAIRCRVETRVDHPNDVFAMHGRFTGSVVVEGPRGKPLSLNRWMVERGHVPAPPG